MPAHSRQMPIARISRYETISTLRTSRSAPSRPTVPKSFSAPASSSAASVWVKAIQAPAKTPSIQARGRALSRK